MSEPSIGAASPGTAQPPGALTADDYQQLRTMALSDDTRVRDQATSLAQKLTPAEATAFVAVQKDAHRQSLIDSGRLKPGASETATLEHRDDNTLFGMPPETVVAMGIPVARAILGPGLTMTARAVLGTKAAATQATPLLKFEFTKSALEKMHVPSSLAWIAAAAVSGYRGNGKTLAPAEEVPPAVEGYDRYMPNTSGTAATSASVPGSASGGMPPPTGPPIAAAPVESPVAAPAAAVPATPRPTSRPAAAAAPPVEPVAQPPAPAASSPATAPPSRPGDTVGLAAAQRTPGQMSRQSIQNDLGMAARRQGLTLSEPEYQVAEAAVRDHAVSPAQAVQAVGKLQQAGGLPTSKLKFSPDESMQFQALRTAGKSGAEAESAILKLRTLAKKLKTPSGQQVSDAVQKRNETGRWDE